MVPWAGRGEAVRDKDLLYALLVVAVAIVALGLAGHEDYEAQLIMDDVSSQPVIVPPPAVEPAAEAAPPLSLPDPRVTFECPHCQSVLSSAEVERCDCPVCGKQLHTHVDRAGEVFTVTDIAPDGAFVVKPDTPAHTTAVVTNMDGDRVDFGVDVLVVAAIREAMRDLEASWLTDLSGLSPSRAICETYRKIEQLQTLRG